MKQLRFDFRHIHSMDEFWRCFAQQAGAGAHFGSNLDALWDYLTGEMALPAQIHLAHLAPQQEHFAALMALMQEAEAELAGQLRVQIT